MKKIAPRLQDLADRPRTHDRFEQDAPKARAELRALLAVARAARLIPHLDDCPASGFDAPDGPGDPCTCPHKRALTRLEKASKP